MEEQLPNIGTLMITSVAEFRSENEVPTVSIKYSGKSDLFSLYSEVFAEQPHSFSGY